MANEYRPGCCRWASIRTLPDNKKTQIAQALYNDKSNSGRDICRTLRISRATLYRYVTTETDERT